MPILQMRLAITITFSIAQFYMQIQMHFMTRITSVNEISDSSYLGYLFYFPNYFGRSLLYYEYC